MENRISKDLKMNNNSIVLSLSLLAALCMSINAAVERCDSSSGSMFAPLSDNCAQYIECANTSSHVIKECPYPKLFSNISLTCENFTDVSCGDRFEPQSPCEYEQYNCSRVNSSSGIPCQQRMPSCVGRADGNQTFPGRKWRPDFVTCFQNRTIQTSRCSQGYFHPKLRKCTTKVATDDSQDYCMANPTVMAPDGDNCAQFYNCSLAPVSKSVVQECPYPLLFSPGAQSCQNFTDVTCNGRYEPQAPCEYESNRCQVVTCVPCEDRMPSCVGMNDGFQVFQSRLWSPFYVTCFRNRTLKVNRCIDGFFNPLQGSCQNRLKEEFAEDFCKENQFEVMPSTENCAQFYNCSLVFSSGGPGSIMQECHYPNVFSLKSRLCENIKDVNCTGRKSPTVKDPCLSKPCVHGECTARQNTYACKCLTGYTGRNCDVSHDPCNSNPCVHGQCDSQFFHYKCTCDIGYTGINCEEERDACLSNPCVYGTCENHGKNYTCHCVSGATGRHCDTAAYTCPKITCLLDCGTPPVFKKDRHGCDVCECGRVQHPSNSSCFLMDCHSTCGDPPKYRINAVGCPTCDCEN